ncbi:MAG: hypothetical protein DMF32_05955 [Verrucomicrobia bacterium]|nr:MAG: hypothetical protein DMF32_05955 [Verrucomicrobiota bacterium]
MGSKHRRIEVFVDRIEQLFNSMDPSPFDERELDDDAEEFIVGWAREFPRRDPVSLVVHVNQLPAHGDAEHLLETAVHNYFTYRANLNRLEFRHLLKQGRTSLLLAWRFWPLVLSRANCSVDKQEHSRSCFAKAIIAGWVAMWASHGNLPLRMVAAPAHGSALRKTEPDARGSAKNESTVTTPWPWF